MRFFASRLALSGAKHYNRSKIERKTIWVFFVLHNIQYRIPVQFLFWLNLKYSHNSRGALLGARVKVKFEALSIKIFVTCVQHKFFSSTGVLRAPPLPPPSLLLLSGPQSEFQQPGKKQAKKMSAPFDYANPARIRAF